MTNVDISQHLNHSWNKILQCDEEVYIMEFCANLGHCNEKTRPCLQAAICLPRKTCERMLCHRPVSWEDWRVVWILRTTSRSRRAARCKKQYREFLLNNHRRSSNVGLTLRAENSVAEFMRKYCRYAAYWRNIDDIVLWQHRKIHQSISSLKRKCSFMLKKWYQKLLFDDRPLFSRPDAPLLISISLFFHTNNQLLT